jgi:uncharacterized surface protein with fasciclin (FAS1) repeats
MQAETVVTMNGQKAATVNGASVAITVNDAGVMVDEAKVVTTDIICDNGGTFSPTLSCSLTLSYSLSCSL